MTITSDQITNLSENTEYERWSLTQLADLFGVVDVEKYTADTLTQKPVDRDVTSDGRAVYLQASGSSSGKGIEQVISDISPLIFASSYKCLDLFIEWFLEINGHFPNGNTNNWTFQTKVDKIKSIDKKKYTNIPSIFESYPRIFQGILRLYVKLVDHRHSIIHEAKFEVNDSGLLIRDKSDKTYTIAYDELFSFAGIITVCIDGIITNDYDYVTKRQLSTMLDKLSFIHDVPCLALTDHESSLIRVLMEPIETEPYRWEPNIEQINKHAPVKKDSPNFWLNMVGQHNENTVCEWIIPGDKVIDRLESGFKISSGDFSKYTV